MLITTLPEGCRKLSREEKTQQFEKVTGRELHDCEDGAVAGTSFGHPWEVFLKLC